VNTPVESISNDESSRGSLRSLEKLLLEAQREKDSSISPSIYSVSQSQSISPISPQSPCFPADIGVDTLMANHDLLERKRQLSSLDWLWDWHARPEIMVADSKEWQKRLLAASKQDHESKRHNFLAQWLDNRGLMSKEVLSFLLFSNIFSVLLGVGIGYTVLVRRNL
jgi:hypothetical protein